MGHCLPADNCQLCADETSLTIAADDLTRALD